MILNDISFHDSKILQVTENPKEQSLDFLLDFPTDWDANIYEKRTLRFSEVITYHLNEIPFSGPPSILEINFFGEVEKQFGPDNNKIKTSRLKVEIQTNSGNRIIEFMDCNFI